MLIIGFLPLATAQDLYNVDTKPPRGFMPTADQLSSPVDNIDTVSGKLNLQIPLASIPRGRGGIGFDLNLQYDSHINDVHAAVERMWDTLNQRYVDVPVKVVAPITLSGGWTYNANNYWLEDEMQEATGCQYGGRGLVRMRVLLPDGSMHILYLRGYETYGGYTSTNGFIPINPAGKDITCPYQTPPQVVTGWLTYYTTDGSYLKVEIYADGTTAWREKDWYVYYPDGRRVVVSPVNGTVDSYDSKNNRIRISNYCHSWPDGCDPYTSIQDDGGHEIRISYNVTDANTSTDTWLRDTISAPGPNGSITTAVDWNSIQYGSLNRRYTYAPTAPPPYDRTLAYGGGFWTVKYIQLPLASPVTLGQEPSVWNSYKFGYSDGDNGWGLLNYMRMPTGSQYGYSYRLEQPASCLNSWDADCIANDNSVSQKQITHDGTIDTWTFLYTLTSTKVTAPDGGETTSHFDTKNYTPYWTSGLVNWVEGPSGSVQKRQWAQNSVYGSYSILNNPYVYREATTVGNSLGTPAKTAVVDYTYDKNGNLLTKTEHDWTDYPDESGGIIRRKTFYDYYVTLSQPDDANGYWHAHNPNIWAQLSARRLNALKRRKVSSDAEGLIPYAATEYSYDPAKGGNAYTNGNVTAEARWDSVKSPGLPGLGLLSGSNAQVLSRTYDSYGNVTRIGDVTNINDPEVRTDITYNSGFYVTRVDQGDPNSVHRSWEYDWMIRDQSNNILSVGVALASKKDLDNGMGTFYTYDNVGRQLTTADKKSVSGTWNLLRQTSSIYNDADRSVMGISDLRTNADQVSQTITNYDQVGRANMVRKLEKTVNGVPNYIYTTTHDLYAQGGRRVITSTPYRTLNDPTLEWTCTQYDLLGRVSKVGIFKGSSEPANCEQTNPTTRTGVTTKAYDAEWTTVTDPALKVRKQRHDGLGRMLEVVEDPSPGLNYSTTYFYDPLDNLTQVTQGTQPSRTFNYSSLSRLRSTSNPESGSASYAYLDSGDLQTRTDARNIVTTFAYDPLHRIVSKTYSDNPTTPNVTYSYYLAGSSVSPNVGRLKSISSNVASMAYDSYDEFGNVLSSSQTINGYGKFTFGYHWYVNGGLKDITYPSGRTVNYDVENMGRNSKVYSSARTYTDMTVIADFPFSTYAPDGRIARMRLGNGLYDTREYHTPGETTYYRLGTTLGGEERLRLDYNYHATQNNGNLQNQRTTRNLAYSYYQEFTYDPLDRLATASEMGAWSQTFSYDRWGNQAVTTVNLAHSDSREPASLNNYITSTNRLNIPGGYDSSGNQTQYGSFTLGYDAENRNISISGPGSGSIAYDGEGRRIKKTWTYGGSTIYTYYLYDALGRLAAENSTQAPTSTGATWLTSDILGSVRAVTSDTGTPLECNDYLPFGRMISSADNTRSQVNCYLSNPDVQITSREPQKFTGKERDAETGLDYFGARYFSGVQGRFLGPDPLLNSGHPNNPQSWNRYSYAFNAPFTFTDPDGLFNFAVGCEITDSQCQANQTWFRTQLAEMETALNKLKEGSDEYNSIKKVLDTYGKENDFNGVIVEFGTVPRGYAGVTGGPGIVTVRFDIDAIKTGTRSQRMAGKPIDPSVENAAIVAHEGAHIADRRYGPKYMSDKQIYAYEHTGFDTQSYVNKAFNRLSMYGLWNPSWLQVDKNIPKAKAYAEGERMKSVDQNTKRAVETYGSGR